MLSLDFARSLYPSVMVMMKRATRTVRVTARRTDSTRLIAMQLNAARGFRESGGECDGVASDGDSASDGEAEMEENVGQ